MPCSRILAFCHRDRNESGPSSLVAVRIAINFYLPFSRSARDPLKGCYQIPISVRFRPQRGLAVLLYWIISRVSHACPRNDVTFVRCPSDKRRTQSRWRYNARPSQRATGINPVRLQIDEGSLRRSVLSSISRLGRPRGASTIGVIDFAPVIRSPNDLLRRVHIRLNQASITAITIIDCAPFSFVQTTLCNYHSDSVCIAAYFV